MATLSKNRHLGGGVFMYDVDIHRSSDYSTPNFSSLSSSQISQEYISRFIQRVPSFGVKRDGYWSTVHGERVEKYISEHLFGVRNTGAPGLILGTLSQWYPKFGILDLDDKSAWIELPKIQESFGLSLEQSSIVFETSENSYHILFRPEYNGKPATVRLLHEILGPYAKNHNVELYPQSTRIVRAPYHAGCKIKRTYQNKIDNLGNFLIAFDNLFPLELKSFDIQKRIDKKLIPKKNQFMSLPTKGVMKEGYELYIHGLQEPNSRYSSQHKVAMYLWRQNVSPEMALNELMSWLVSKNNGYSKDASSIANGDNRTLSQVTKEHVALVDHIWNNFEKFTVYPDSTHNSHNGWYTKKDIETAIKHSGGNIPRFKFLAKLLAYFNSRKKLRLSVHRNNLASWSSAATYLKHIEYFENNGILTRENSYLASEFAKTIKLHINPSMSDVSEGFHDDFSRALSLQESLDELGRKEVYDMLVQNDFTKQQAYQYVESLVLV